MLQNPSCVFCRIIAGELSAKLIYSDDKVIVIEDIAKKAEFHYLVIPKKHIEDIKAVSESSEDRDYVWSMIRAIKIVAAKDGRSADFKIVSNNGPLVGQSVAHMHWHFLAGKNVPSCSGL